MKALFGFLAGIALCALLASFVVPRAEPSPALYTILVTYCGEIPVGVIVTGSPPTFIPYEELNSNLALYDVLPEDIMAFDICKAPDVKTDV